MEKGGWHCCWLAWVARLAAQRQTRRGGQAAPTVPLSAVVVGTAVDGPVCALLTRPIGVLRPGQCGARRA